MHAIAISCDNDSEAEVWRQLADVHDPELDESVTELGFVERLEVDGGDVAISFRLPTYWCAPNFAFIMARDIRDRVSRLPWVRQLHVRLVDHCTAEAINDGIATGRSFDQVFPNETTGELAELRQTFRRKAFMARQDRLLKHLGSAGWSAESLIAVTLEQLRSKADLGIEGERLRGRYFAIRDELGLSVDGAEQAFTTVDGDLLTIESFDRYLSTLRKCRLNMEINTHFCRGLLQVRYGLPSESASAASAAGAAGQRRSRRPPPDRPEPLQWMGSTFGRQSAKESDR